MDPKQQQAESTMAFPVWAIVIIAIVVVAIIGVGVFFLKRRRNRSLSVDTIHRKEDDKDEKKSATTLGSTQTLVTQKKMKNSSMNTPPLPSDKQRQLEEGSPLSHMNNNTNVITDKPASLFDESEYNYPPPDPPQEIKISLPLPPPSTSFFSDKMELDGSDQDLYDMYLSTKKKNSGNEFISIDLDSSTAAATSNVPSFYSSAASNIQQKAATIRSSLIQSLRLQSKSNNRASAQTLFSATNNTNTEESLPKKSNESYRYQLPINNKNDSTITTESAKTVIDTRQAMPTFNNSAIAKQALEKLDVTHLKSGIVVDDESPITPNTNLQEPVRAAKRVIRSASRKTKSRSVIVNDNDIMNNNTTSDDDQHIGNNEKDDKKLKQGSIRFASIRGPRNSEEHMTITSGSMRRLVRESVLYDDDSIPSIPVASSAAMASTKVSSRKSGGISAVDIAGWWENKNDAPKNPDLSTAEASNSNFSLPLFQNISAGSHSSGTPNQYRASLSTSIFGTLSKSNGAVLGEMNKDDNSGSNTDSISRHNSFRKGTFSRNTLRNITSNATNGVNRSLKGLFDHSSGAANKVVPDDSQKTELDSEPIQIAIEEKTTIDPVQHEQQKQQYNSVRQKSIRVTALNRPALPKNYLPTSESSTKYALSDEASFPDEPSQKTSFDESSAPISTDISRETSNNNLCGNNLQNETVEESTKVHVPGNNTNNGEVDVIRRILQDTWINNVRESGSMFSIASDTDTIATTSTQQSSSTQQSGTINSKLNPRQQNQALLSKSLLTQQVAKRASLVARTGVNTEEPGFVPQQGPEPSASFSSSTVRTMVPESSHSVSEPVNIRQNAITSNNGSNKIQESSYDAKHGSLSSSVLTSRFSSSPMDNSHNSPRNSSAESSRGHSRKSSGGNSAATALRISSGYSANAKTWNGRAQKKSSRPSVTQLMGDDDNSPSSPDIASPSEQGQYQSFSRGSVSKRAFFSTMRKGQKNRGSIPWMMEEDEEERTPAQIERDKYLGKP